MIIPAFALGRVEELLYWVHRLEAGQQIPHAAGLCGQPDGDGRARRCTESGLQELDPEIQEMARFDGHRAAAAHRQLCAFCTERLKVVASIPESRAVQESNEPSIVISSSGMATGGRVLHHLAHGLPDPRNTVLLAGFQAEGTRGRQLKDGASLVKIHGQMVPVRARIEALDSMSAHADSGEIMRWLGGFKRPPALTCLVHGEPGPMDVAEGADRARAQVDGQDAESGGEDRDLIPSSIMNRPYFLEQIEDAAVVQVYADGFDALPLRSEAAVWHLYQAALAGRDIYYDQRYRHALEMRDVLEAILVSVQPPDPAEPPDVIAEIRRYTKLFWINSGPHHNLTARKFVLKCPRDAFRAAAHAAARAGAVFPIRRGETLDASARSPRGSRSSIRMSTRLSRPRRPARVATSSARARTTSTRTSRWTTSTGSRSATG